MVPAELAGTRLDVALGRLAAMSRSRAAELIDASIVQLDGVGCARSRPVAAGAVITVAPRASAPAVNHAAASPPPVLLEDEHVIVVDKPVGMAAHPSPGWTGPTVVGTLRAAGVHLADAGPAERQGVVHRLDAGTSGAMVLAKSHAAYVSLKRQFRDRLVDKTYHALVQGHPDPTSGTIDAPIGRHPRQEHRFAVVTGGRDSVTHYTILEAFRRASLLEIELETGRTHQIRVHLAAIRHPCCGDLVYGADPTLAADLGLERQWLHAVRLAFDHPFTGDRVVVSSAYPRDLSDALHRCRAWG